MYVPQSKHAHLIAGPANVYFNRLDKAGKLQPIDFEEDEDEESDEETVLHLVLVKLKILRKHK